MKNKKSMTFDKMELRSEKVRKLLGKIPSSLVICGTIIIVSIFIILLLSVFVLPYPYSGNTIWQVLFQ